MKILYISSVPLPSPFANRLQVTKMSEAFAGFCDFTLLLSTIKTDLHDVFRYYHVTRPFKVVEMGKAPRFVRSLAFAFRSLKYIKREAPDFIFIREAPIAFFLSWIIPKKVKIIFEVHDYPEKNHFFYRILFRSMYRIISTNKWKAQKISEVFGISQDKFLSVPNGVDLADFNLKISKDEARKKLGIPLNKKIIVYTGSLFSWKGGDVLLNATRSLPVDFVTYFVGGTPQDQINLKNNFSNLNYEQVKILPHQPHDLIPFYLKAADVLAITNTAKEDIAKYYTSPIKLFEYMASERPIIASDLPSIREVVSDKEVVFFEPDNSEELAKEVIKIMTDLDKSQGMVQNALDKVKKYTWDNRAKKILTFLQGSMKGLDM